MPIKLVNKDVFLSTSTLQNDTDWECKTKEILYNADQCLKTGHQLQLTAEESLVFKIKELIVQHDWCNNMYNKKIAEYKDDKFSLEQESLEINLETIQMKENIKNIEDMIIDNEALLKLAVIKFNNRALSSYAELSKNDVETTLRKEMQKLKKTKATLQEQLSRATLSLETLNKMKNNCDKEIQIKTGYIKADEVECMSLRSSVQYYSY